MHHRLNERVDNLVEQNDDYETDVHYALQLCKWILKPIGLWFLISDRITKLERVISAVLIIICLSGLCFIFIPSGYQILFQEKNMNVKIKAIGPCIFCITATFRYCYLGLRSASFRNCIKHLENDWKLLTEKSYRTIMMRNVTVSRNLTTLSAVFLYTGGLCYHTVMPLLSKAFSKNDENFTVRPLIYSGYDVLFDSQASPAYEIVFSMHCLFSMIMFSVTTAGCSLAAIFVTHACGQIQIQVVRLKDLNENIKSVHESFENPLTLIVRDHVRTLRFSAYIEEVLREICLMEIVTATLIICLLEYCFITEWKNNDVVAISTYCSLLISFTFNILIFCYIGEFLVEEGSKIGAASYEIEWYRLPGKKALDLVMLIAMSHRPPKITGGKMFDLSMNTFSTVLQSSVVYLNLLRTVSD